MTRRLTLLLLSLAVLGACSRSVSCGVGRESEAIDPTGGAQPQAPSDDPDAARLSIAFLGDSLTAGYGLNPRQGFPYRIQEMFHADGYGEVEAIDAGITADTTAGGLRRVDQVLDANVRILVVGLGGNDALRGLTVTNTHDNLAAIIEAGLGRGVRVMLAGMEAPTNLGEEYRTAFRGAFIRLSQEYRGRIYYLPFLLEGVAGNPSLNQSDGIHPNEAGVKIIAELLYPKLKDMVDEVAAAPPR